MFAYNNSFHFHPSSTEVINEIPNPGIKIVTIKSGISSLYKASSIIDILKEGTEADFLSITIS
jgi:hypothetical protein